MRAIAKRVETINAKRERLKRLQDKLDLINKYGKPGIGWKVRICLKPNDGYRDNSIETEAFLPFEVVQQRAVYEVDAARRELIQAGGMP